MLKKPVYNLDDKVFAQIVRESRSVAAVGKACESLGYGGDHNSLKRRIAFLNLETGHFIKNFKKPRVRARDARRWLAHMPDDEFAVIVSQVNSVAMFCRASGKPYSSSHSRHVQQRAEKLGISLDHFIFTDKIAPLNKVLVRNSRVHRTKSTKSLMQRLVKENVLANICMSCGTGNQWNGQPLRLHLYRKNGVVGDNRIENLEILCPNCRAIAWKETIRRDASLRASNTRKEKQRIEELKKLAHI